MLRLRPLLLTALAAAALAPAAADAGIVSGVKVHANYDFNGHLGASYPRTLDLTQLGAGNSFGSALDGGEPVSHWHFAAGNGLVAQAPSPEQWTVSATFRFGSVTGRKRILGVQAASADAGFYLAGGKLVFDTGSMDYFKVNGTPIAAGEFVRITIRRTSEGHVEAYVNGVMEVNFTDTANRLLATEGFRFFADDTTEEGAGDIRRLQVFKGPLHPAEIAQLQPFDQDGATISLQGPPEFGGVRYVGRNIAFQGSVGDDGGMGIGVDTWLEQPDGTAVSPVSSTGGWLGDTATPLWNASQWMYVTRGFGITAPAVEDGQPYRIMQRTTDNAGNELEQPPLPVVGDTVPPSGLQITGVTVADGTPTITGVSDPSPRESYSTRLRVCAGATCDDANMYDSLGSVFVSQSGGAFSEQVETYGGFEGYRVRLGAGMTYTAEAQNCDSANNCETVARTFTAPVPAAPAVPTPAPLQPQQQLVKPAPPKATPASALLTAVLKALKQGKTSVAFAAPGPGTASVKVLAGKKTVASGKRTFAKRGTAPVKLKTTKALRRARRLTVQVRFAPKAGRATTAKGTLSK